jgi:CHASE2 domain-containing sensor protein
MLRKSILLKLIITIVGSAILSILISFISERVNILEKFTVAVSDVDFTDQYYQYKPKPKPDDNIVIVNIGYRSRTELAEVLRVISLNQPKVIGGDIFFDQELDTVDAIGTRLLANQLKEINNLVLVRSSHF